MGVFTYSYNGRDVSLYTCQSILLLFPMTDSGHLQIIQATDCLETHTGSQLEVDETISPADSTTVISNLTTAHSSTAFHDSTRLPSKTSGHCFETNAEFQLEDVDTATSSTMVRNLTTRNLPFRIQTYRKVQTFRKNINRLHQLNNQYPVDIFNSFVASFRSAKTHLLDERSSEGHD
jgi:hypothetical protein